MRIQFEAFDRMLMIGASMSRARPEPAVGYTNRCKDGLYIPVLDYDDMDEESVIMECLRLQAHHDIGTFYIFSTTNGYHAVCLDKMRLSDYLEVLHDSSVDPEFHRVPLTFQRRCWVLRLSDKRGVPILHIKTLERSSRRIKSKAHMLLLKNLVDKMPDDGQQDDGCEDVMFARYKT